MDSFVRCFQRRAKLDLRSSELTSCLAAVQMNQEILRPNLRVVNCQSECREARERYTRCVWESMVVQIFAPNGKLQTLGPQH